MAANLQNLLLDINGYYSLMNLDYFTDMQPADYVLFTITDKYKYRLDLLAKRFLGDVSQYIYLMIANGFDWFNDVTQVGYTNGYNYSTDSNYPSTGFFTSNTGQVQAIDPFSNYPITLAGTKISDFPSSAITAYNPDITEWVIDDIKYTNWSAGISYSVGDYVFYIDRYYQCILNHTSINFTSDALYWTNYNVIYYVGDYVIYGNQYYKCINSHTSSSFLADLGNWKQIIPTDFSGKFRFVLINDEIYKLDRTQYWFGIDNTFEKFAIDLNYKNFTETADGNYVVQGMFVNENTLILNSGDIIKIPTTNYLNKYIEFNKKVNLG